MRIGSLFTGYGGLDLAIQGELVWYSEIDPAACSVLSSHHPGIPNLGDIKTVDWSSVPRVDILTGGYPCQPFSSAGLRKGSNDKRHLWPHVREAISHLRPGIVVLENVRGHLSLGFSSVLADLADLGYDARWGVVRASEAGAAHARARIFIVAEPSEKDASTQVVSDSEHDGSSSSSSWGGLRAGVASGWGEVEEEGEWEFAGGVGSRVAEWGEFGFAIERWERIVGRVAPAPLAPFGDGVRINPVFVEWLMGLPSGWVTGRGLSLADEIRMLGNGVVPQQAQLALSLLGLGGVVRCGGLADLPPVAFGAVVGVA